MFVSLPGCLQVSLLPRTTIVDARHTQVLQPSELCHYDNTLSIKGGRLTVTLVAIPSDRLRCRAYMRAFMQTAPNELPYTHVNHLQNMCMPAHCLHSSEEQAQQ